VPQRRECAALQGLAPSERGDAARAYRIVMAYLGTRHPDSYHPEAAWGMLDAFFVEKWGWSTPTEYTRSEFGGPFSGEGLLIHDEVHRLDRLRTSAGDRSEVYDFFLSRVGITSEICGREDRRRLTRSMWELEIDPVGGNAPAYVIVVHRTDGFFVISSDV
jgi:hypothetical protein